MPVVEKALRTQRGKVKHHAELLTAGIPIFARKISANENLGRLTLEAAILTAARSVDSRLMTWSVLDLDAATWTVPAEPTKAGREHVVPISPQALALLERMRAHRREYTVLVAPGQKRSKPLSKMTLTKAFRDMGICLTVHGFAPLPAIGWQSKQIGLPILQKRRSRKW